MFKHIKEKIRDESITNDKQADPNKESEFPELKRIFNAIILFTFMQFKAIIFILCSIPIVLNAKYKEGNTVQQGNSQQKESNKNPTEVKYAVPLDKAGHVTIIDP